MWMPVFSSAAPIHDVAQGSRCRCHAIGPDCLEIASMTKMLRVAMIIPMLIIFMFIFASKKNTEKLKKQLSRGTRTFLRS